MGKKAEVGCLEDKENVNNPPRTRAANQPRVKGDNQAEISEVIIPPGMEDEIGIITITLSSDDEDYDEEGEIPSTLESGLAPRNPSVISQIPEDPKPGPSRPDTSVALAGVARTPLVMSKSKEDSSSSTEDSKTELQKKLNDIFTSSNKHDEAAPPRILLDEAENDLTEEKEKIQALVIQNNIKDRRIFVLQTENKLFKSRTLNLEREKEIIEIEKCLIKRDLKATKEKLEKLLQERAESRNMGNKRKRFLYKVNHTQSRKVPGGVEAEASTASEQNTKKKAKVIPINSTKALNVQKNKKTGPTENAADREEPNDNNLRVSRRNRN